MSKKTRLRRHRTGNPCFCCNQDMPADYPWMICDDCCPPPGSIKRVGRKEG
jgi:hypothetical protein